MGVDFHKMAEVEPDNKVLWDNAIKYHNKHKEIADVAGKFLSHINLGIIYQNMGDIERSAINHQFALRYAIQMSSVTGQSIAIGNLGQIGTGSVAGDNQKLQMFVERYLSLSAELKDRRGEGSAHAQLGNIGAETGSYEKSQGHFYRAMKIGQEVGDSKMKETSKCNYGIASASARMDEHMKNILSKVTN